MSNSLPVVLTVAGSDSGGGAGVQTDLRTFNTFNVYGCSAVTAVTAQNPNEVRRVDIMPLESVKMQLASVLELFPVRFAKTGMLANKEIVECVAEFAGKYNLKLIVDPVMISTSGACLLEKAAISVMQEKLFPLAEWITPNIPEAEFLCNRQLTTMEDLAGAARQLFNKYKCNCLLKGGHAAAAYQASDIVCYQGRVFTVSSPAVQLPRNTAHGTGCTLSAAITAILAKGGDWQQALTDAKAFVYGSLTENRNLSDTLTQMFPPVKNYSDQIYWKEL